METNLGCVVHGHKHGSINVVWDSRKNGSVWESRCINCQSMIELARGIFDKDAKWELVEEPR